MLPFNRISSIDGDLFDGLDLLRLIDFDDNDMRHVRHNLNIPINSETHFHRMPCIDQYAMTPDEVASLKLNLLRYCRK